MKIDKDTYFFIISFLKNPLFNLPILFRLLASIIKKIILRILPQNIKLNPLMAKNRFFSQLKLLFNKNSLNKIFKDQKNWKNIKIDKYWISKLPETDFLISKSNNSSYLINLAQSKFYIEKDNKIEWHKEYEDDEDTMSLHRFDWLIRLLIENNNNKLPTRGVDWITEWIEESQKINNDLINDSYTISERLMNLTLFFCATKKYLKLSEADLSLINKMVFNDINHLVHNLEYVGKKTNNHIINNARALYVVGRLSKVKFAEIIGRNIIENETDRLLPEGVLNEASSHYQLLLTRSYLEIYWFAFVTNDLMLVSFLKKRISKMLNCCNDLIFEVNKKYEIPFIGDISPDYPPSFFCGYPFTLSKKYKYSPWSKIWGDFIEFEKILPKQSTYSNNSAITINNQWIKNSFNNFDFIMLNKREDIISHLHQDDGSFCLFYKKNPVIIDPGLTSYVWKNKISKFQTEIKSHNVITLNDIGLRPSKLSLIHGSIPFKENYVNNSPGKVQSTMIGYRQIGKWNKWKREILFSDDSLIINDYLDITKAKNIALQFVYHKNISIFGKDFLQGSNNKINFKLEISAKNKNSNDFGFDSLEIINGYSSSFYGDLDNCKIVKFSFINKKLSLIRSKYTFF